MRTMEPHENILNLLGQCTMGGQLLYCHNYYWLLPSCVGGPVCLIVEFASYGNLRDFLRQCEEVVLSLNHLPHIPRNRCAHVYARPGRDCDTSSDLAHEHSLHQAVGLLSLSSHDKTPSLPPAVATPTLFSHLPLAMSAVGAPVVLT